MKKVVKTGRVEKTLPIFMRRPPKGVLPPVGGTGAAQRVGRKSALLDYIFWSEKSKRDENRVKERNL